MASEVKREVKGGKMLGLGTTELIIIFAVILLLFGATRIPQLAGSLGRAIKEFKKSTEEESEEETKKEESVKDKAEKTA